jgi:hypothetical protein
MLPAEGAQACAAPSPPIGTPRARAKREPAARVLRMTSTRGTAVRVPRVRARVTTGA